METHHRYLRQGTELARTDITTPCIAGSPAAVAGNGTAYVAATGSGSPRSLDEVVLVPGLSERPLARRGRRAEDLASGSGRGPLRRVAARRRPAPPVQEPADRAHGVAWLEERAVGIRAIGMREAEAGAVALWTAPRIILALGQLAAIVGRTPTIGDLESRPRAQWPSPSRVRVVFGSWGAALAAAGLRPKSADHSPRRVWSDEEILQAIQDAAAAGDPGPGPFKEGRRRPDLGTITARFGSWSTAESLALGI